MIEKKKWCKVKISSLASFDIISSKDKLFKLSYWILIHKPCLVVYTSTYHLHEPGIQS